MNASASPPCLPSADSVFGPVVEGCRDNFDFTLTFEQYFFSIVPSTVILLLASIRLYSLRMKQRRVGGNTLKFIKLSAIAILAVLQLTSIILWAAFSPSVELRDLSISACTLSFVTSLIFCALSYTEHTKSLTPSPLLNAYLPLSLLFDGVILRTLWLTPFASPIIRNLSTAALVLKAIVLLLEAREKRKYLSSSDRLRSPEETSSFYSQGFFWWLNSLITHGFNHILKPEDLFALNETMSAEVLDGKFQTAWKSSTHQGKHKLLLVTISVLKYRILYPVFPRLFLLAFTFCQPLLLNRFLAYLQEDTSMTVTNSNVGWALVGAYALVYFGMAISNALYAQRSIHCVTSLRSILVTAIFAHTTELSISTGSHSSSKPSEKPSNQLSNTASSSKKPSDKASEKPSDNSAAVTLMSTDVESIVRGLRDVHELWACVFQVLLATGLLWVEIGGAAGVVPLIVGLVSAGVSMKLSTFAKKKQMLWMKEIQKRVGITSTMVGSMKGIKMSGLTEQMSGLIASLRVKEVQVAKKFRILNVYAATLGYVPVMISPVITFAIFTIISIRDNKALDVSRMFTSLSLILLLTQPLFYVFLGIEDLMASIGCFERIGKFLISETRKDHRLMLSSSAQSEELSIPISRRSTGDQMGMQDGIELTNLRSTYRGPFSTSDKIESILGDDTAAILVNSGSFGWTENGNPVLNDINLSIQRSKLTLLVGPIASGKTTLLKALLGEVLSSKGFVYVSSREIAWCEQTPWLINASVQRNIIGFSNFEIDLYKAVVFACDLEEDIARFPNGDQSIIGSKGITLSGGQKQRIAIARAVYTKKEIAMFDDIFSSLDSATETKIFGRLFGPQGLLRRRKTTVVLATHAVNLLPYADQIIALGEGTILEKGTLEELNAKRGYVHNFCIKHSQNDNSTDLDAIEQNPGDNSYRLGKKQDGETKAGLPTGKGRQQRDLSVYKYYMNTIGVKYTCIFLILQAFWAFFSTFPVVWLKWWTDANASHSTDQQTGLYLGVYSGLQITALLSHAALIYFSFNHLVQKSGLHLHATALRTVMRAPLSFFATTDTGSITTRFSQDMQLIDTQLPLSLMCVVSYILICTIQGALIASATPTPYVAISLPLLILVFYLLQKFYLRTSRQLRFLDLELKGPVYTLFLETLGGLSTLRAFGWEAYTKAWNYTLVDHSQRPFYLLLIGQRWLALVLDLITCAMAVLVVSVAVAVKLRGETSASAGFTGVALTQLISFTANMKLLISFWSQMETSIGAVARVKQFEMDTADENLEGEVGVPSEEWPKRGEIVFENVSATYGAEGTGLALDNVSLTIRAGEKIGICGRTGSGKSSLVLALLRLLEISKGRILVDGVDISHLPRSIVRSRLNALPQDPLFMNGYSIRENLDPYYYFGASSFPAVSQVSTVDTATSTPNKNAQKATTARQTATQISALEKVGLWPVPLAGANQYIPGPDDTPGASPENNLDKILDGALIPTEHLSQGQQQLFALARGMLRRRSVSVPSHHPDMPSPPGTQPQPAQNLSALPKNSVLEPQRHPHQILLLDEPLSSTDRETESSTLRRIFFSKETETTTTTTTTTSSLNISSAATTSTNRDKITTSSTPPPPSPTTLMITHRQHALMNMDRVLVMDDSRVVAFGPPGEVLGSGGGGGGVGVE